MRKQKKQHPPVENQAATAPVAPVAPVEMPPAEQSAEIEAPRDEATQEAAPAEDVQKPVEPVAHVETHDDATVDSPAETEICNNAPLPPADALSLETAIEIAEEPVVQPEDAVEVVRESDAEERISAECVEEPASAEAQPAPEEAQPVPAEVVAESGMVDAKASDAPDIPHEAGPQEMPSGAGASVAVVASSTANKCFNALAWLGPLAALLVLLAQTLPGINLRGLIGSENSLPALVASLQSGTNPFLLLLDGTTLPDLSHGYLLFLAGLDSLWQLTPLPYSVPLLLLGGSIVAAFLLLVVTWSLARLCGSNGREAFAACAVLLCTVIVCFMERIAIPDLLFAACITASCLCLYSGWMCSRAPLTLLIGYLLAGLATLIAGPVGLVLPLGASLLFLFWRGTFRRAGAADGAFGFAVLLLAIGGGLAWLGLTHGRTPVEALLNQYVPQWSLAFWSDPQLWLDKAVKVAVLLLPWPFLLLFLPWERLYRLPVLLWRNRKENPGIGFVWCALLVGLIILSFTYPATSIGFAPVLPFLAVILGRAILRLSPARSKGFFGLVGVAMFVSAVALGLCSALPFITDWLPADLTLPAPCKAIAALPGAAFVAGAALLFSFILLKLTDKTFPGGGLLMLMLFATVAIQPVGVLTLPSLVPLDAVEAPAIEQTTPADTPAETPAETTAPAKTAVTPAAPAETQSAPAEQAITPAAPATPAAPVAPATESATPAAESAPAAS